MPNLETGTTELPDGQVIHWSRGSVTGEGMEIVEGAVGGVRPAGTAGAGTAAAAGGGWRGWECSDCGMGMQLLLI